MTRKNKILILLCCLFPWMWAAADPVVTSVGSGSICPENEVVIPITVSNCNGVAAISLALNFDNTRISYEGYQNVNSAVSTMLVNQSNGTIYMTWANMSAVNVDDGTLLELRFTGLPDYSGYTYLNWNTSQCEYSDVTGTALQANYSNGSVNVYAVPNITSNPSDRTIAEGQNTYFDVSASGQGLSYQWQIKTPADNTWQDLTNDQFHGSVNNWRMYVYNVNLDMDGNQYRCVVSGTCPSPAISEAATLSVEVFVPTIVTSLNPVYSCADQIFSVPVHVTNCNNVGAVSLVLNYNSNLVTYVGYENANPELENGTMRVNATGGTVYFTWASSNHTLQIGNGDLISFAFKSNSGNSSLSWNTSLCEYSNQAGVALPTSFSGCSVNIYYPPTVTSDPTDKTIMEGNSTNFSINASGQGLSYQWQMSQDQGISWETLTNGGHYSSVTSRTLYVNNVVASMDGYRYRCVVNGTCEPSATSNYATLHVETLVQTIATTAGSINTCSQIEFGIPISVTNCNNVGAISLALAYNTDVMTYTGYEGLNPGLSNGQLQVNAANGMVFIAWASIAGASIGDGNLLTLNFTALSGNSNLNWNTAYCEYANPQGSPLPTSYTNGYVSVAELSFTITTQPANQTVVMEEDATFSIETSGTTTGYQWQVSQDQGSSWSNVTANDHYSNPTTNTLSISNVPLEMNGYRYRCAVGGTCGLQYSSVAILTVQLPPNYYEVSLSADPTVGGTTEGAGAYEEGTSCTVTAIPATGYDFVNWTENEVEVSQDAEYTFTVEDNHDLVAHFALQEIDIVATVVPAGSGTINGSGTYLYGDHVLLTAIPATGYVFDNWTENGEVISSNQSISFTAQADRTLEANFSVLQVNITATPVPASNGSVTGAGTFPYGTTVNLIALANEGFQLGTWTENDSVVSTSDTLTFMAETDRNLVANFIIKQLHITAVADPTQGGTITGAGTYNYGDPVVLTATPLGQFEFYNWTENGEEVSTQPTISFTAYEHHNLVAHFITTITIAVTVDPEESGTIQGAGTYNYADPVTLTAVPNTGYSFANWTESDTLYSTATSISLTAYVNRTFVAHFDPIMHHVTVSANNDAAGTVSGGGDYQEGSQATVSAQPNEHYEFIRWMENGTTVSTYANYTFTVYGDRNLVAEFSLVSYEVTASANPTNGGEITGTGTYFYGDECTLTAIPDSRFTFVNWTVNGAVVSTNMDYTFTVTSNVAAVANFECALPLGLFANMLPADNDTVTNMPVVFSWDAVSGATRYDLYLWIATDPMPSTPYVSNLTTTSYSCNSLSNYQAYQWRVKARNYCNETLSEVKSFSLNVEPELQVSTNSIDFGEVELTQSESRTMTVSGIMLENELEFQIVGNEASMFSYSTNWGWNNYSGGTLTITFTPTVAQWSYNATLIVSSGELTQSVALSGNLANIYQFNTYVDEDIYPMNSVIPIYGTVTYFDNTPVADLNVDVSVTVMGRRRILSTVSDENGEFSVNFETERMESGYYTVNSGVAGHNSTVVHDSFNILGIDVFEITIDENMNVTNSSWILCDVTQDIPKTGYIKVRNRNSFDLSNIQMNVLSAPEGANFTFTPMATLAGLQEGYIQFTALGTIPTAELSYQQVWIKAFTDEGAEALFTMWFYCDIAHSVLEVAPTEINTTMTRGESKTIDVTISNHGEAASGEITISLPDVDWMETVGQTTLPSIEVGETTTFTLRLSPDSTVPLTEHTGSIQISCESGNSVYLPYSIMAVSVANGALLVDVTDEFTTNTNGGNGPHVEGAEVTLTGYYSHELVAHGFTGADGTFSVEGLAEGYYTLNVQADSHNGFNGYVLIEAGTTNQMDVFLQYQSVTYSWIVEPTEIEDHYEIVLDIEFDVEVPVPVITISAPACITEMDSAYTFNYVITNHGLIDAYNQTIYPAETEHFRFTPLYNYIDTIHAHESIEVPCEVTRKNLGEIDCGEWGETRVQYSYLSGSDLIYNQAFAYTRLGSCTSCYHPLPPIDPGTGGGGGGGGGTPPPPGIPGPVPPINPPTPTPPIVQPTPSVHVRVGIQFSQSLTMTREAFIGTFTVQNSHETNAVEGIGLDFVIKDAEGIDHTDLFQISTMSLEGVTEIDGTGTLAAASNGTVRILFIPTRDAAPTEPIDYYFGGTFTFVDPWNGATRVMELYPSELTVHPSPDLYIDYFVSEDVYGDNPLTPVTEPIIPAELAVRIWNKGAGTAKNVRISSSVPTIVSNQQGLLINFGLYGTYMQGQGVNMGVSDIDFGNIESGETKVGEWLFTSTLLAHVVSYEASVVHNDSYGNPNLSLISHVGIHKLAHAVFTDFVPFGAKSSGINDFLVDDVPDENNYPDYIFFSDGRSSSVDVAESVAFDHFVTAHDTIVTLTVNPSSIGWNYGETADPGRNYYKLLSCTRNDGVEIPLSNVWQESILLHTGDYANDSVYVDKLRIVDTVAAVQPHTYSLVFSGDPLYPYVFFGTEDEYWSNVANWENDVKPYRPNDNVVINGICELDEDATVSTLTIEEGKILTISDERTLTVSNMLTNTAANSLVIEEGGQLIHANAGTWGKVKKSIEPWTNNNNGWYLVASPLVGNTDLTEVNDLLLNTYDLYYYDEPTFYWINQKMPENNFTEFENGTGYLYANLEEVTLEFAGELQNGAATVNVPLSYTPNIPLTGFNLVGNPFAHNVTSYASENVAEGCYLTNETKDDLMVDEINEENPLKPGAGFFVKATDEGASITFNAGRGTSANPSGSIRVEVLEKGKIADRLIVKRTGEPLEKISLNEIRTKLFATQGDQEIAIVPCEGNEQAVSFKAAKNDSYTINVSSNGIEFYYLHLIDNLTGMDVDLLKDPDYTFEAHTSDYASRFLLRFIPKENSSTGSEDNFAYCFNNKWVIANEGEATLQVVDVVGHILSSEQITGSCEKKIDAANGVYMLRLINGKQSKVQKIVVR